jgi:hypothetical protein
MPHGWAIRIPLVAAFVASLKLAGTPAFQPTPSARRKAPAAVLPAVRQLPRAPASTSAHGDETLLGFALGTVSGMLAAVVLFRSPAALRGRAAGGRGNSRASRSRRCSC